MTKTSSLLLAMDESSNAKSILQTIDFARLPDLFRAINAPLPKTYESNISSANPQLNRDLLTVRDLLSRHGDKCRSNPVAQMICREIVGLTGGAFSLQDLGDLLSRKK